MMKRIFPLLCLTCCLVGFIGCGSNEGELVTDKGTMTFKELQEMQARSLARETEEDGKEDTDTAEDTEGL